MRRSRKDLKDRRVRVRERRSREMRSSERRSMERERRERREGGGYDDRDRRSVWVEHLRPRLAQRRLPSALPAGVVLGQEGPGAQGLVLARVVNPTGAEVAAHPVTAHRRSSWNVLPLPIDV